MTEWIIFLVFLVLWVAMAYITEWLHEGNTENLDGEMLFVWPLMWIAAAIVIPYLLIVEYKERRNKGGSND